MEVSTSKGAEVSSIVAQFTAEQTQLENLIHVFSTNLAKTNGERPTSVTVPRHAV
jgi:hypothetical protein